MATYIYKDGKQLGPYSNEQLIVGLEQGTFLPTDKAWKSGLMDWMDLNIVLHTSRYPCPQCKGILSLQVENPQRGTGIIVIVLGILLAPFCVGIFLMIWGLALIGETKSYWHCRGCGRTYPA
jgi:uncharacterized protein YbaR (Trm112 family)